MAAKDSTLTAERARELLNYNPETGIFTRRAACGPRNRYAVGTTVGCCRGDGYVVMSIESRQYLAHRIAWLVTYGYWAIGDIDHIDGNPSNNRLDNLREVTRAVNLQNRHATSTNKHGIFGVTARGGGFCASIYANGRSVHLGQFATIEAAGAAYLAAKRRLHPGYVE